MALKRNSDQMLESENPAGSTAASPFLPIFETFRKELDEHHDRRERVIKASRDITAASKKVIFALQRARDLAVPVPANITNAMKPHKAIIETQFSNVSRELQGINGWRYARNISGGNQEFIEAACFEHYLSTGTVLTYEQACDQIRTLWGDDSSALLSVDDYLLGVYDTTGELMRFAITCMATSGRLPAIQNQDQSQTAAAQEMSLDGDDADTNKPQSRDILTDLRMLRSQLESLDVSKASPYFAKEVRGKAEVMRTSVEKVERAMYSLVIRGRERPKGWVPDADAGVARKEIDV